MNERSHTVVAVAAVAAVILLAGLTACQSQKEGWVVPERPAEATGQQIHVTGVIRHLDLEGGVYTIQADDGTTYNPMNLPPEFQKEGLAVEVEARRRDDMAGIHQVGPLIELERIRSR
jgi:hypothetical protein